MNLKDELREACREIIGGYRASFKDWSSPMPHAQFLELLEFGRRVGLFDEPEVTVSIEPQADAAVAVKSMAPPQLVSGGVVSFIGATGCQYTWFLDSATPELIAHQLLERMKADPSERKYVAQAGGTLDAAPSDAQPIVEADLTVTVSSGPRRPFGPSAWAEQPHCDRTKLP